MSANLQTLADAVADALVAETWPIAGTTVERMNWVQKDVEELNAPAIIVTPGGFEPSRLHRSNGLRKNYTVYVYLAQRVDTDLELTAISDMAESLVDRLFAHQWDESVTFPNSIGSPLTVNCDVNPDDALNDRNVWRAAITVSYPSFQG